LRAPIWLYRLRLGWLLGQRFVLLTHTGRKSRLPRQTVVEVVHRDPATGTVYIASGWGRTSDWFQNIRQTPQVTFTLGARTQEAMATQLTGAEAATVLRCYATAHPTAFHKLTQMMTGESPRETDAAIELLANAVPVVSLRPIRPPGPDVD
jgi:deazaflavin-dependent oxidoreductase (nitroreductase family)